MSTASLFLSGLHFLLYHWVYIPSDTDILPISRADNLIYQNNFGSLLLEFITRLYWVYIPSTTAYALPFPQTGYLLTLKIGDY
jgi:hypothetical protein